MTDDAAQSLDDGITAADPQRAGEHAQVKKWAERIEKTRQFDEDALKQYALDRRYARGDSGFSVDANLVGTFIDILTAFLYAKDPDVDVLPARSTEPPSIEALRDAAELDIDQDPRIAQAAQAAQGMAGMLGAMAPGALPMPPDMVAQQAAAQMREQIVQERFNELQASYRKRQRDNKAFAETLELVISRMWKDARLKLRGRAWVRSGLTIAVGWIKATWQERMGQDPITVQKIADLRDNIAKAAKLKADMEEQSGTELEATIADYQAQLAALSGQAERVLARGFVVDPVNAEDITVAPGVEIARYLDAPWIDNRIPMRIDDIVAEFKLDKDKAAQITRYAQRKPVMQGAESGLAVKGNIEAKEADQFKEGTSEEGEWGMVHETWDRDANRVLTWIEGVKCWARAPYEPQATSRFYPFFLFALGETDGQRHPQSLISRSAKLVDEYNRIGQSEREHRARCMPGMLFLEGQVGHEAMTKVTASKTGEYTGVSTTNPQADLRTLFMEKPYPKLDPGLYDRSRIVQELERIWGVQEALAGGITVDKTATEAQIQQTGMQARTGSQRDTLEDALCELALYTAEVARAKLSLEDVQGMVGPDAMWPDYTGAEDLARMVNVDIRAGSSGKPNTTAERQAWATLLPMLQQGIGQIAMLRNSLPTDVADAQEKLLRLTIERSGERIDIESIVPPAGPAMPAMPAGPGAPAAEAPSAPEAGGAPTEPIPTPPVAA